MKKIIGLMALLSVPLSVWAGSYPFLMLDDRAQFGVPVFYSYQFMTNKSTDWGYDYYLGAQLTFFIPIDAEATFFGLGAGLFYHGMSHLGYLDDAGGADLFDYSVSMDWLNIPFYVSLAYSQNWGVFHFDGGLYCNLFLDGKREFDYGAYYGGGSYRTNYTAAMVNAGFGLHFDAGMAFGFWKQYDHPAVFGVSMGFTLDIGLVDLVKSANESFNYWGFGFYFGLPFYL